MRQRNVKCYDTDSGLIVDDAACSIFDKPPNIEPCQERRDAKWKTSEWSSCSGSCVQVSSLFVFSVNDKIKLANILIQCENLFNIGNSYAKRMVRSER